MGRRLTFRQMFGIRKPLLRVPFNIPANFPGSCGLPPSFDSASIAAEETIHLQRDVAFGLLVSLIV
jgi:hypothetical protein